MKWLLKWMGVILGSLVGIILLALVVMTMMSNRRLQYTYEVTADFTLDVPDDPESIAAGGNLFAIYCESCHGEDLAGEKFSDDFAFGQIYSANLTVGANGIGSTYSDEDIARAIWYGVKPDGSPTVGMPYEFNYGIHIGDMQNLIAYLRSVPPVDTNYPVPQYGPLMRVMHVTNLFPVVTVENVDISQSPLVVISPEDTLAYGEYLAVFCSACHMPDFAGSEMFGSPNITPHETAVDTWTEEAFLRAVTEGSLPDGGLLDPEQMPWQTFSLYTDEELHAIWTYLQTVDAVAVE
jgi:mono/diheme cytochrome c family protein